MKNKSHLQSYLNNQYALGNVDSEGHFTIAVESAVKKLGQSALPSEISWVLKVIQAAVLRRSVEAIAVKLHAGFVDIEFEGPVDWDAPRLHGLVDDLEARPEPWEMEILAAIRDRLVEEHRFILTVEGSREILFWSGEELRLDILETESERSAFSVQTGEAHYSMGPSMSLQMLVNLRMAQGISDHAFFCSIPITLDGKRLDTLYRLEAEQDRYGILVEWGYCLGDRKDLWLPQYAAKDSEDTESELPRLLATLEERPVKPSAERVDEAWLLRAHYSVERSDKSIIWREEEAGCHFLFVKSGIIVDSHQIPIPNLHISLTVVLDCSGHIQDMSGFRLVQTELLEERKKEALNRVLQALPERLNLTRHGHEADRGESFLKSLFAFFFPGPREIVSSSHALEGEIEDSYTRLRSYLNSADLNSDFT